MWYEKRHKIKDLINSPTQNNKIISKHVSKTKRQMTSEENWPFLSERQFLCATRSLLYISEKKSNAHIKKWAKIIDENKDVDLHLLIIRRCVSQNYWLPILLLKLEKDNTFLGTISWQGFGESLLFPSDSANCYNCIWKIQMDLNLWPSKSTFVLEENDICTWMLVQCCWNCKRLKQLCQVLVM